MTTSALPRRILRFAAVAGLLVACQQEPDEDQAEPPRQGDGGAQQVTGRQRFAEINAALDTAITLAEQIKEDVRNGRGVDTAKTNRIKDLIAIARDRKYRAMATFPNIWGMRFGVVYVLLSDLDDVLNAIYDDAFRYRLNPDSTRKAALLSRVRVAKAQKEELERRLRAADQNHPGLLQLQILNLALDILIRRIETDRIDHGDFNDALWDMHIDKRRAVRGASVYGLTIETWYVFLREMDRLFENGVGFADMAASGLYDAQEMLDHLLAVLRNAKETKELLEPRLPQ